MQLIISGLRYVICMMPLCGCVCVHAVCMYVCVCVYMLYRNLGIFRIENISYVIISYSFNFVHSPYCIRNTCENFIVEKYSYV